MTRWIIKNVLEDEPDLVEDWGVAHFVVFYTMMVVPALYVVVTTVCGILMMV